MHILFAVLLCVLLPLAGGSYAAAQAFPMPGKPVRIIVPYPAGGHSDSQARIIGAKLGESLGVPVVVENRPGASTLIATQETIRSAPDGHTLLCTNQTVVMLPHLYRVPPYDAFRDLTPLTEASVSGMVLIVHESLPVRDARQLIAYARQNPQALSYGSAGAGSPPHLGGAQLARLTGVEMLHVPYKGSTDLMRDLVSGRLQFAFDMALTAMGGAATGKTRLIAAATERRLAALPDLPTLRESGIDIAADTWLGFFGPGGMPAAVVESLHAHLLRALKDPATVKLVAAGGSEVTGLPPAEFARVVRKGDARWGQEIRALGVRLD
jgi:tripartite-type tricarboxylate transporter receptor subunit TctC